MENDMASTSKQGAAMAASGKTKPPRKDLNLVGVPVVTVSATKPDGINQIQSTSENKKALEQTTTNANTTGN